MADDYNPDTFDWGDDPGIPIDDVAPDIIEQAVQAALNVQEQAYGWRYLKRSDVKESAGRVFRVKHHMPKKNQEWFEENFPYYTFIWDGAMGHHDHPVSNLCNELNELEMVEELVRSGEQYIDLFGNGNRDRKYKRNCINLYTLSTPKDYLRHQNLGANDLAFDMEKLCDPATLLGKINRLTCTHALYYLSIDQIGRIVNTSKKRKLSALIHRHRDTHGFLNDGEQEYWVGEKGVVKQVNVATGESYSHPSLEALFHQGSARTVAGGVAWTIRAAGGDSFFIDFVGCPNEICEVYTPLMLLKPESWEEYSFSNLTVKKFLGWTWMSATTGNGKICIEDVDLFSKLRRYVAGKQRTPRLKTETMNTARRLCNKADIISIHGGGAHEIPVASMADYVEVAFYVDVKSELDAALSFHKDNQVMMGALNKYYEKGELPKDLTAITGVAMLSAKTFSDAAIGIINNVRDAQDISVSQYLRDNLPGEDLSRLQIDYGPEDRIPGPWW
jgi:hypothetical protein